MYIYIYTSVERALRARIGEWALVGPPLGPPLGPGLSPGPSPHKYNDNNNNNNNNNNVSLITLPHSPKHLPLRMSSKNSHTKA